MKLVSTSTELSVVKNLCGKDMAVSGTLLAGLDESYFHNTFTRKAFERAREFAKENGNLPKWSVLCEDPALSEKVREKLKEAQADRYRNVKDARVALTRLNEYRQLRGIYEISEAAVQALRQNKVKPSKLLDQVANQVVSLRQNKITKTESLVFGKGNNSMQFVKDMMDAEKVDYIPTGFASFDEENQGFGWGNLVVVAGTTGGGKSTLAAQFGINWMQMGEDVTFVPLEMTKKEMASRIMANASDIDVRKILFGKMSEGEKKKYWKAYKKFVVGAKKVGGTFRIFKPESDMTIEEIMASIYPFGSRIVIIDYISLLKGADGDDAWQKLGAIARYCKVYAETNNMLVVLLAQLSDEGMIRYARAIQEHANYMWKFIATETTREQEIINVEQAKARNGRLFPFTLRALMNTMRVRDLELDEKEELEDNRNSKKSKGGKDNKFKKDKLGKKSKSRKDDDDDSKGKSSPSKSYLKDLSEDDD